jgi:amino acid transporter
VSAVATSHEHGTADRSSHGLRANALTFFDAIVMALAGTAPAFSIAATTGVLFLATGYASPAALLYCSVPMLGIAWAFSYLNRLEPNASATYAWVGRAIHPIVGFLAGWCCVVSVTLFMVAGSVPVASLTLSLFSASLANNLTVVTVVGCAFLLVILATVMFGVTVSAKAQWIMTGVEIVFLAVFAVLAFVHIAGHSHVGYSWSWFGASRFHSLSGFAVGALIAAYYFWGWDVTANLSEETKDSRRASGAGGIIGVFILLGLFLLYTVVIQMVVPAKAIAANTADLLSVLGHDVWPAAGGKVIVVAVLLSSLATLETALIQSTRSLLVMSADRVIPKIFGQIHPRWRTPWIGALVLSGIAVALFVLSNFVGSVSTLLTDAVSAIGLQIAIYYGLAGLAVAVAYRKVLLKSVGNFVFIGLWPLLGGVFMLWIFGESVSSLSGAANAVGLGAIGLGIVPLGWYLVKGSPALRRQGRAEWPAGWAAAESVAVTQRIADGADGGEPAG